MALPRVLVQGGLFVRRHTVAKSHLSIRGWREVKWQLCVLLSVGEVGGCHAVGLPAYVPQGLCSVQHYPLRNDDRDNDVFLMCYCFTYEMHTCCSTRFN